VGRLADRVATVALGAVVALAACALALSLAGVRPRVEMSDSMAPSLRAGDLVWLRPVRAAAARAGDVIAFADPAGGSRVLVHRVASVAPAGAGRLAFVTRGDANTGVERWRIGAGGTVGRYTGARLPHAGRLLARAHGAPLAVVALLSGATLAGMALRRIWGTA
jgi:signal peptidase I